MKSDLFSNTKGINIGITVALIAIAGVLFGAILNGIFGRQSFVQQLFASQTPTPAFRHTPIPLFAPPAMTPALQTTPLSMVGEEDLTTPTLAAPSPQSPSQTEAVLVLSATATPEQPAEVQITDLLAQLQNLPIQLNDSFEDDANGWTPFAGYGYAVAMQNGALQLFFSEPSFSPFLWTCDACGQFERYAYQVDVKIPQTGQVAVAGLVFGSPTPIDEYPFKEAYALGLYNNGSVILQRISAAGMETVQLWDKNTTLLKPDGQAHTLQVIADGQQAWVVIDGKPLGEKLDLTHTTAGYIGLVAYSTNTTVYFDNLKVIPLP